MRRVLILLLFLLPISLVGLFVAHRHSQSSQGQVSLGQSKVDASPPAALETGVNRDAGATTRDVVATPEILDRIVDAPITLYGRVVDEVGSAIPAAEVAYSVPNLRFEGAKAERLSTDTDGNFCITGLRGAGLFVSVRKQGYYFVAGKSERSFGYGIATGDAPPTRDHPAIFELRRSTPTSGLITYEKKIFLKRDGSPVGLRLVSGEEVPTDLADLVLQCYTDDPTQGAGENYHWKLRLGTPSGAIIERSSATDFVAPEVGYGSESCFEVAKDAPRWTWYCEKHNFVKTRDGYYARVHFLMSTIERHYGVLRVVLNPTGARHLEPGPAAGRDGSLGLRFKNF